MFFNKTEKAEAKRFIIVIIKIRFESQNILNYITVAFCSILLKFALSSFHQLSQPAALTQYFFISSASFYSQAEQCVCVLEGARASLCVLMNRIDRSFLLSEPQSKRS